MLPLMLGAAFALHCGGSTYKPEPNADGGNPTVDGGAPDADDDPGPPKITAASKVDVLVVVDNSTSMGDKAEQLAASMQPLLERLAPTNDVHLGVISTSLGAMGGDVCQETGDQNMHAYLSTRGPNGTEVASASGGFLTFGPGGTTDIAAFTRDAQLLVRGIGQTGCGLEAQLESAYRFLVQPDPWVKVSRDQNNQADLGTDVDETLLQQRAKFLRPDSLLLVLMLTDEDDSSADPRAIGGQGWAFMANQFPGSTVFRADGRTTTAPRATSACKTSPASPDCTSCAFAQTCNSADPACQKIKSDPECQKNGGYYGPTEEQLNVRFHRMKERFGVDPQFPISRYVDGFTRAKVYDRAHEHVETKSASGRREIAPYGGGTPGCRNPIFAASLPTKATDELCDRPRGPRSEELVVFALLGGVPRQLVESGSPSWTQVLGENPDAFDYNGIDPHMIPSVAPRPGLPPPTTVRGDNGTDPVHGREWDTRSDDLQYACTFTLPTPKTCSPQDPSCDCARPDTVPPLCGATVGQQVRAKAYPTTRELRVAKALGDRGIVGSVCAADATEGYKSFMSIVQQRIARRLTK
jgi:hypothetical protein